MVYDVPCHSSVIGRRSRTLPLTQICRTGHFNKLMCREAVKQVGRGKMSRWPKNQKQNKKQEIIWLQMLLYENISVISLLKKLWIKIPNHKWLSGCLGGNRWDSSPKIKLSSFTHPHFHTYLTFLFCWIKRWCFEEVLVTTNFPCKKKIDIKTSFIWRNKESHKVWNYMRVSKRWQNVHLSDNFCSGATTLWACLLHYKSNVK